MCASCCGARQVDKRTNHAPSENDRGHAQSMGVEKWHDSCG